MSEYFFAPCPRGLEPVLVNELVALGARSVVATHGGVEFEGDWQTCYRANLESRIATRVLWRVGRGRYRAEEDIYRFAYSRTWAKWFTPDDTIRIHVTARQSQLKSLEFITLRVKDAVCDHFRSIVGSRPNVDTHAPDVRIHVFLSRDECVLYIDTSGEPLYKRGFKQAAVEAPLKENLAAGILSLIGWKVDEPLVDPMCGSGTFLIEAAHMALDIAPGLGRRFGFEQLKSHDRALWASLRAQAEDRRKSPANLQFFGSDVLADQVRKARTNLEAAGVARYVELQRADFVDLEAPAAAGVLVTNPPYGVRIGEAEELAALYPSWGSALKRHWAGWRCHFLTADTTLPRLFGLKASRKTPLYNGALECRVYEFKMVAGSMRKRGEA